jgi:phosphoribosylformylglycinamidine cyclo-ligase
MPDIYHGDDFDMAGFCVGVVELKRAINPKFVKPGDIVLGLASHGVHSNGYSLVRKIVDAAGLDLKKVYPELLAVPGKKKPSKKKLASRPLGEVLLTPTRIYASSIMKMLKHYTVKNVITGMAHITGSGMEGNLCRALPPNCDAIVDTSSWPVLPVFTFLQQHGNVPEEEMRRVFNMGIGYCVIVRPAFAESVAALLKKHGETVYQIGKVVKGKGRVIEQHGL